jgi:O-antigen/teichoic acid export membrane protein
MSLGFAGCASSGLIIGEIIGQVVAATITTKSALKSGRLFLARVSKHGMFRQAKRYCDFPRINLPHALGDMLQVSGILLVIAYYFNPVVLGYYAFSMRVLRSPIGIVGGAVSQVFYQKAVAVYNVDGDLRGLVAAMIKRLALISAPIFVALFVFAPTMFSFVFGAKWAGAGVYVQILSPWMFLSFIASPISQIPIIVQRQRQIFFVSILGNSMMLLSVFAAGYFEKSLEAGLCAMSGLMSVYMAAVIWWTLDISGRRCGNV